MLPESKEERKEIARRIALKRREENPFPDKFVADLEGSPDKNAVLNCYLSSHDKARFNCPTHGLYYQTIKAHLKGQSCPKCGRESMAISLGRHRRGQNPLPQWFLDDIKHLPNYEQIVAGEVSMHEKVDFICSTHGVYKQMLYNHLAGGGCPQCSRNGWRSKREREVTEWLQSQGIEVVSNAKGLGLVVGKSSYEIDVYLPKFKVGFEFNGYFYHKSGPGGKPKYYHRDKTDLALRNGIKLFHFWEDTPLDLVKSIILTKLGLAPNRVYARNCSFEYGKNSQFFNDNHVDGDCRCIKQVSLKYNGIVVASISLRLTKNSEYEIARFACKKYYSVVGAYSKLLKEITKDLHGVLISYCNRDLSPAPDDFYAKYGFEHVSDSLIMKYWANTIFTLNGKTYHQGIYPRQVFQKWKLSAPECMTEQQYLESLQVFPVYNSGNKKYKVVL